MRKFGILIVAIFGLSTINAQTWESVAAMPSSFKTDHSFGFALDGKGYMVTGNRAVGPSDNFYEYDPITDEWTQLEDFPGGSRGYGIGDIMDGKAYFGFGTDGNNYMDDLWEYDPSTGVWTELASCDCQGRLHPAMVAIDGKIFVGLGNNDSNLNDWWEYDLATDSWEIKAAFPAAARHHPYQFGFDGYAYTGFGHGSGFISDEWYRFDPVLNEWDQMADIPDEGRVAGTQFSYNGRGYALSGEGESHSTMVSGEFWEYDPVSDSWTELPPHPGNSRWAPASFVLDGEVYLINGMVRSGFTNTYQTETWKFSLDEFVSIRENDLKAQNDFLIYPNPAKDQIRLDLRSYNINMSGADVVIYNSSMQIVDIEVGSLNFIDISDLSSGLYFIQLNSDGEVYNSRFVVE